MLSSFVLLNHKNIPLPQDLRITQLCGAAAELLAARSRYAQGRGRCALYHAPTLAWEWLVGGQLCLQQMPSCLQQVLMNA